MIKIIKGHLFLLIFLAFYTVPAYSATRDTLNVLHISDTHVIYGANYHPVFSEARKHCLIYEDALKVFFSRIPKKVKADFVVHTGDILDYFEAETSIGTMLGTQIEQFYTLYDQCPVPLYMTLGNHDISSYQMAEDDSTIITMQIDADTGHVRYGVEISLVFIMVPIM